MAVRVHFLHRHLLDTVVILEEGPPPPPTVHLMRHDGPLVGTYCQEPYHSSVCQGNRAEEAAASGGRAEG